MDPDSIFNMTTVSVKQGAVQHMKTYKTFKVFHNVIQLMKLQGKR